MSEFEHFPDVATLLAESKPAEPVYCVYPHVYRQTARQFVDGFPGRVLYAVKACSEPAVLEILVAAGVEHFDCASLPEIQIVKKVSPGAKCYFMVPVRLRGEARAAMQDYDTRHFVIDHLSGIEMLANEIDMSKAVVFARMAVHHAAAMWDLSSKFGAPPADIPELLEAIAATGAEPALAFNVGSSVTDPEAYSHAISVASGVLGSLDRKLRLVDVGGGYPRSYPGFVMPPLDGYFEGIRDAAGTLPLADNGEILGEPGRAMAGPGLSAISEVLQRKDDTLYINDGMHGIFWELRYEGHDSFPYRCFRDGRPLEGEARPFTVYGPTCDSVDVLPAKIDLPLDIRPGDYLEFGRLGAYSLSGRTDFNGRYSSRIVMIDNEDEFPPGHAEFQN